MSRSKLLLFPLLALIISGCSGGRSAENKHVELGMTKREVMNQIGDPDITNVSTGKWYYYDPSFF